MKFFASSCSLVYFSSERFICFILSVFYCLNFCFGNLMFYLLLLEIVCNFFFEVCVIGKFVFFDLSCINVAYVASSFSCRLFNGVLMLSFVLCFFDFFFMWVFLIVLVVVVILVNVIVVDFFVGFSFRVRVIARSMTFRILLVSCYFWMCDWCDVLMCFVDVEIVFWLCVCVVVDCVDLLWLLCVLNVSLIWFVGDVL